MGRIFLLNKPYDVLCQFTDSEGRRTLAELLPVPGVYPAGRLDRDSEGLVVLTDDGALQHRLSDPRYQKQKGYWVQVEGIPTAAALERLCRGVLLQGKTTRPARARPIDPPPIWPRDPPIRHRKTVPDAWIELYISEGMNRQVRRMTAAVGLPTLRLIRFSVGPYTLGELAPGAWREVPASQTLHRSVPQTLPPRAPLGAPETLPSLLDPATADPPPGASRSGEPAPGARPRRR